MTAKALWIDTLPPQDLRQLAADWAAAQPLPAANESRLWQRLRMRGTTTPTISRAIR